MDEMTKLSIQIAEATVPDEIDLAPLITEAFLQGGKEKKSLFAKQKRAEFGAFGPIDSLLLFPHILNGIATSADFILQFLSIDETKIATVYYLLGINHYLGIYDKVVTKEEVNELPEKHTKFLKDLFETFSSEIKATGLSKDQCDKIIANVLVTLRKNPSISSEFVEKIASSK